MSNIIDLDEQYRQALARKRIYRYRRKADSPQSPALRIWIAAVVISVHALGFGVLTWATSESHQLPPQLASRISVWTIQKHVVPDKVPLPEIVLDNPVISLDSISRVSFGDVKVEVVGGITAPASAPQIDSSVSVDVVQYATRAGLVAGEAITVILSVEVLPDGSAGEIALVTGSGDTMIDGAAIECARQFRWIPGTVDRRARAMRINVPLTLAIPE